METWIQTHICDKCSEAWNFYHYCKVEIDELIRERLGLILKEDTSVKLPKGFGELKDTPEECKRAYQLTKKYQAGYEQGKADAELDKEEDLFKCKNCGGRLNYNGPINDQVLVLCSGCKSPLSQEEPETITKQERYLKSLEGVETHERTYKYNGKDCKFYTDTPVSKPTTKEEVKKVLREVYNECETHYGDESRMQIETIAEKLGITID